MKGAKRQLQQGSGDRGNVTAIITVCADGTTVQPTLIFKGKNIMKKIAASPNGWTDGKLGLYWIQDFNIKIREKANGQTWVLFLDGHSSHHTSALLCYAQENKIEILTYPPHTTHALQGLDVICFAIYKTAWKDEVKKFEKQEKHKVTTADFTGVSSRAFLHAFTPEVVRSSFAATGIFPFNQNIISTSQMKPSEATSVKGSFPMQQASPVRA
ncbi:hypothetical protein SERLA73DRAFT_92737, partial [Serpula lacrymans var. lacrymans S7.3]